MSPEKPSTPERGGLLSKLFGWLFGAGPAPKPKPPTPPKPPKEEKPMPPQTPAPMRDWTILLYMAGDNGKVFNTKHGSYSLMAEMTTPGHEDIAEVEKVGTTDRVAVLAQFDTLNEDGTYRLEIHQGKTTQQNIVQTIAEANTGDPAELAKFIVWGMTRCPAKHTLLVLWNHGLGWKDDDVYAGVRSLSRTVRSGGRPRQHNAAMFKSVARKVKEVADQTKDEEVKGILCDDNSMDFLTNVEMSRALRVAEIAADEADAAAIFQDQARLTAAMAVDPSQARRRLSAIGMDACLMAMLEVQYQVRQFADVMIASQEVEPIDGWPYTQIVGKLNAAPTMTPNELGKLIVEEYAASYLSSNTTQSAIDLTQMENLRAKVGAFGLAAAKAFGEDGALRLAYSDAARGGRRDFEDKEYLDLAGFVQRVAKGYAAGANTEVKRTAEELLAALAQTGSPVIANAATGTKKSKATGISIYVPMDMPSPLYKELDFAAAGWLELLEAVYQSA